MSKMFVDLNLFNIIIAQNLRFKQSALNLLNTYSWVRKVQCNHTHKTTYKSDDSFTYYYHNKYVRVYA